MKTIDRYVKDNYVRIEYDENEYDVEILYSQSLAVLRRNLVIDGNKVICHVFDLTKEHIIKQIENHNIFYTITETSYTSGTFSFYNLLWEGLDLKWQFENIHMMLPIKEGVFILYDDDDYAHIYNALTNKLSIKHIAHNVYIDKDIMDYIDPKYHSTVLIKEDVEEGIAKDTITYGIDVDDMELATKIWSTEQQRYIKKYNKKETAKRIKEITRFVYKDTIEKKRSEATFKFEVEKYLELLDKQGIYTIYPNQDKRIMVYDDDEGHIPNKEHLKHLRRDYRIKK